MKEKSTKHSKAQKTAKNKKNAVWFDASKKKPKCNDKFGESDYVLCYAECGGQFVGWYNKNEDAWRVSHHIAPNTILRNQSTPSHWMPLPPNPPV